MADKKISELQSITSHKQLTGDELAPLSISGSNRKASLSTLKSYFRDSVTVMFADFVDGYISVTDGTAAEEDGATLEIVYSRVRRIFVLRKTLGGYSSYFSSFDTVSEYMADGKMRTDRVYFCEATRKLYSVVSGILTALDYTDKTTVNGLIQVEEDRAVKAEEYLTELISANTSNISSLSQSVTELQTVNATQDARIDALEQIFSGGEAGDINTAIISLVSQNKADIAELKTETITSVKSDNETLLTVLTNDRVANLSLITCTMEEAEEDEYADGLVTARDLTKHLAWDDLGS